LIVAKDNNPDLITLAIDDPGAHSEFITGWLGNDSQASGDRETRQCSRLITATEADMSGLEIRIMQNGSGWYWEVLDQNWEVVGRGIAITHAQARIDAAKILLPASLQALSQILPVRSMSIHFS